MRALGCEEALAALLGDQRGPGPAAGAGLARVAAGPGPEEPPNRRRAATHGSAYRGGTWALQSVAVQCRGLPVSTPTGCRLKQARGVLLLVVVLAVVVVEC